MELIFRGLWSDLGMNLLIHGVPLFFASVSLMMAVVAKRRGAWMAGAAACRWLAVLTAIPVALLGVPAGMCTGPVGAQVACSYQVNGLWLLNLGVLGAVVLSSVLVHRRVHTRTATSS